MDAVQASSYSGKLSLPNMRGLSLVEREDKERLPASPFPRLVGSSDTARHRGFPCTCRRGRKGMCHSSTPPRVEQCPHVHGGGCIRGLRCRTSGHELLAVYSSRAIMTYHNDSGNIARPVVSVRLQNYLTTAIFSFQNVRRPPGGYRLFVCDLDVFWTQQKAGGWNGQQMFLSHLCASLQNAYVVQVRGRRTYNLELGRR